MTATKHPPKKLTNCRKVGEGVIVFEVSLQFCVEPLVRYIYQGIFICLLCLVPLGGT